MAIDPTVTSGLAQIAETLEALAGIIPSSALKRDTDVIARLKRINDSIQGGAIEAHTLTSHSDVSAASIAGTYLRNDGANWSESAILFADLPTLSLPSLSDVTITAPINGNILQFNGSVWTNTVLPTPVSVLDDLTDVTIAAVAANQQLFYNGSLWVNGKIRPHWLNITVAGGEPVGTRTHLVNQRLASGDTYKWLEEEFTLSSGVMNDVANLGPTTNQVLTYIGGTSLWEPRGISYFGVLLANGSVALTAPWNAAQTITVPTLKIDATVDHQITDETNNVVVINGNSDGDVIFRINDGGTSHDLVTIDASNPNIIIEPTGGAVTLASSGIIEVKGSWGRAGPWGAMRFNPTMTAGIGIGFLIDPLNGGSSSITGIQIKPTVGAALASVVTGIEFTPGSPSSGSNATHTGINESMPRALLAAGTWTLVGAKFGASATALGATAIVNDTHISLTGGGLAIAGGTVTQYGIRMQGYGTNTGSTIYALHSNGGTFALAADNQKLNFGAGEDASIYYDGTDLFIDPEVVGTGLMQFNGPASWLAAGATGTPALGNLPTAAAGTFNGWLTVKDDTGTTVYIPSFV